MYVNSIVILQHYFIIDLSFILKDNTLNFERLVDVALKQLTKFKQSFGATHTTYLLVTHTAVCYDCSKTKMYVSGADISSLAVCLLTLV